MGIYVQRRIPVCSSTEAQKQLLTDHNRRVFRRRRRKKKKKKKKVYLPLQQP